MRGAYRVLDKYDTEEYEARFEGRVVRVRQFRDKESIIGVRGSAIMLNHKAYSMSAPIGRTFATSSCTIRIGTVSFSRAVFV